MAGVSKANLVNQESALLLRPLSEYELGLPPVPSTPPEPKLPPVPSTPPPLSVFDVPPVVVSVSVVRDIVASSDVSPVTPSVAPRERIELRDPLPRVARVEPLPLLPPVLVLRFFAAVLPLDDSLPLGDPDELDVFFAVVALLRAFSSAIATACFCAFFFDDGRLFPIDPDFS